jgi:carboxyl-terminal processing protease
MPRASHVAAFLAGAIVAAATFALAVPKDVARFRAFDAFAQSLVLVSANYVDPVDEQAMLRDAMRGMLHNLDTHSTYLPPSRYKRVRQDTEGEFGSVGLVLGPGFIDKRSESAGRGGHTGSAGGAGGSAPRGIDEARPGVPPYPVVDEVLEGSPAQVAGIQVDDRVVSIDGAPTAAAGKELKEAGAWEARLRGASGTRVSVAVLRVGWKQPRAFTLVRAQIKQPSVTSRVLEPRLGYLAIARFAEATSADVGAALAELRKKQALGALVLDLRNDPGGIVDQAILVADQFLDDGVIVTIRGRRGSVETQRAHKGGPGVGVPIVVLVDQGTASAAEILAAALRDNGRATLVGLPTFGKGTVQTFYDLDDGAGLKLTTARYLTPKGNFLESKGLVPDVRVEAFTPEEIVAGGGADGGRDATMESQAPTVADDPQLAAAIKLARQAARGVNK